MRPATAVVVVGLLAGLVAIATLGVVFESADGGELSVRWVSETPRDNEVNHHAVGVGPDDEVIVAPLAAVPDGDTRPTNTSCALVRLAPSDGRVLWRDGVAAEDCFTHALTEPAIADLDGDGRPEIAAATTEDALLVLSADGRESARVPLATYGYGRPTVAAVAPGGEPAVVASDIAGNVVLARGDGTVRWRRALNRTLEEPLSVWAAPIVTDVDGDEAVEVVVGTNQGPAVLRADGTVDWVEEGGASTLAVADVNEDRAREVLVSDDGTVRALDGRNGTTQWTRDLGGRAPLRAVAEVDGSGTTAFVGGSNGAVRALEATTGRTTWTTTVAEGGDPLPAPVLGDVDRDGSPEVIVVTRAGTVAVLAADTGAELARYRRDVPIWTFARPADLDDDGRAEVLVRYGDGRVVALDFR